MTCYVKVLTDDELEDFVEVSETVCEQPKYKVDYSVDPYFVDCEECSIEATVDLLQEYNSVLPKGGRAMIPYDSLGDV